MTSEQEARQRRAKRLLKEHGSVRAAARAAGIPASTFQHWLDPDRVNGYHKAKPEQADETETKPKKARILSESELLFHAHWTPEDCLKCLRDMAEADPETVITRNHFRNTSGISESTWNRYFGTFEEYKRQARIILSRHAHRLEKAIAKHASVDVLREMNVTKRDLEGKYLRPVGRRFQTLIHLTDLHDKECDPFVLQIALDTIERVKPDQLIIGGDLFDLPEFGKYGVDPREWDVVGRIKAAHAILAAIRARAPDTELTLVEGNHEARLLRHLAENDQPLRVVLSDLHGFTVPKLLGLDTYEVNYIARLDLNTFTERDIKEELNRNYYIAWDAYLVHHFPHGKNMGYPGANGHHHRYHADQAYSPQFGPYQWLQLGAMHRRHASYTAGEGWGLGFNICHVDTHTKRSVNEYITVSDHAMVGGRFYERPVVS